MRQLKITKSITNRDDVSLNKYFSEIGKYEMITVEEEVELARKIKEGDEKALEKMIKANLRFVVSVAKQYQNQGLSLPDLIDEGNLGLIKAATKFDETRGFKFISYAVWWIRQSIMQSLADQSRAIRLPWNKISQINKINRAIEKFEQTNGYPPQPEELEEILGISKEEIESTLVLRNRQISLDAPLREDNDENNLLGTISSSTPNTDQILINDSLEKEMDRVLNTLPKRNQEIIKKYYGIGCDKISLEEIWEGLGMTRERVRQVKEASIKFLRKQKTRNLLKNYLG